MMKYKKYYKAGLYFLTLLFLVIAKFNEKIFSFMFDEINVVRVVSRVSSNLYDEYTSVGQTDISVLNYYIKNDIIYISPINNEVILPVNGIISKINKNGVYIETTDGVLCISNINNLNYRLYQYYDAYSILGSAEEFTISLDIDLVSSEYIIDYEKV